MGARPRRGCRPDVHLKLPRVHALTDDRVANRSDLLGVAEALADGGAALHARAATLGGRRLYELAEQFAGLAPERTFINDRVDIALALGELGLVLKETSLPLPAARGLLGAGRLIGRSVHDAGGAALAGEEGADFLVFGPVFRTATHPGRPPAGIAALTSVAGHGIPVIAVGGVTRETAGAARRAGAYGVAAIRGLWDASDAESAARAMLAAFDGS